MGGADAAPRLHPATSPRAATWALFVSDQMGRQAPEGLLGIRMYLLMTTLDGVGVPAQSEQERAALAVLAAFRASGLGYFLEKGYPHLTCFNEAGRGGRFAAWEEPGLFASEVRAAFESVLTTAPA